MVLLLCLGLLWPALAPAQDVTEIQDNSLLLEEAYNQETGEVQHTLMPELDLSRTRTTVTRGEVEFSQEWPLDGDRWQISYALPLTRQGGEWDLREVRVGLRYQATREPEQPYAFAPALIGILQKNPLERGIANGFTRGPTLGAGILLPVSKTLSRRVALHLNASSLYRHNPYANDDTDYPGRPPDIELRQSRWTHQLGLGVVYALVKDFHLLFETVGEFEQGLGNDFIEAETDRALILNPGFRARLPLAGDTDAVLGVGFPVELTEDGPPVYRVLLYTSLEHTY